MLARNENQRPDTKNTNPSRRRIAWETETGGILASACGAFVRRNIASPTHGLVGIENVPEVTP
jgi:hypothetical protein